MPIKEKLANRNSQPLTTEMYENYPGFRGGFSLRCFPKSLPRWLANKEPIRQDLVIGHVTVLACFRVDCGELSMGPHINNESEP